MDLFRKRVKENIEKSFKEVGLDCVNVRVANNNIQITGDSISAWIRLTTVPNGVSHINEVDINNISIDSSMRRKGIFTRMMRNLKKLKTVDRIKISSVCTKDMVSWCESNGCMHIGGFDYLYK